MCGPLWLSPLSDCLASRLGSWGLDEKPLVSDPPFGLSALAIWGLGDKPVVADPRCGLSALATWGSCETEGRNVHTWNAMRVGLIKGTATAGDDGNDGRRFRDSFAVWSLDWAADGARVAAGMCLVGKLRSDCQAQLPN